jgi:hypothetical protein
MKPVESLHREGQRSKRKSEFDGTNNPKQAAASMIRPSRPFHFKLKLDVVKTGCSRLFTLSIHFVEVTRGQNEVS